MSDRQKTFRWFSATHLIFSRLSILPPEVSGEGSGKPWRISGVSLWDSGKPAGCSLSFSLCPLDFGFVKMEERKSAEDILFVCLFFFLIGFGSSSVHLFRFHVQV